MRAAKWMPAIGVTAAALMAVPGRCEPTGSHCIAAPQTPPVVFRYPIHGLGAYESVRKHVGDVLVNGVVVTRAGRRVDGKALWRFGVSLRNPTRQTHAPVVTLLLFQGARPLGTLTLFDGGFPLPPLKSAWHQIRVALPPGVVPDGFAVLGAM